MKHKSDKHFMDLANKEGEQSLKKGNYPAGCVIVKDGKIISRAFSNVLATNDVTAHSEMNAIRKACKKLKTRFLENCVLYANIEPCLMCAKAMVYARIKKVVYGTAHKEYGEKRTFDILKENWIGKDIEEYSGFEKEKAEELLNKFFKMKIKI